MPKHTTTISSLAPSVDSDDLRATAAGTAAFARRFAPTFAGDFYRRGAGDLSFSSIGIGTYLGEPTDADDEAYAGAVCHAVGAGVNVVDAAINYRAQRSERAVGAAVQRLLASGVATRQELIVCSKGGYIPLDGVLPASREEYRDYVRREYVDQEILRPEEIVAGGHSLAPRFLRYCVAKSRQNLGLRCIDVYYLHNPEQQLGSVDEAELDVRLRAACAVLEDAAARKEIGVYGVATWDGLRSSADSKAHLSLERLTTIAHEVAGETHHFKCVQLPINLAMPEGVRSATQGVGGRMLAVTEAAVELGLTVIASASLMQAKLASGLPNELRSHFPGCDTDAQRALSFVRGVPGLTSALVGMRQPAHVNENLAAAHA
jgi:aryl-alcohol dehydrogenase-like predicted oxidoreductase